MIEDLPEFILSQFIKLFYGALPDNYRRKFPQKNYTHYGCNGTSNTEFRSYVENSKLKFFKILDFF